MKKSAAAQFIVLFSGVVVCLVSLTILAGLLIRGEPTKLALVGLRLSKTLLPGESATELSLRLGMKLAKKGHFAEAKKVFEELLVTQPQNPSVLNNLAYVLAEMDNPQSALEYLKTAVQVAPTCAECFNNLGTLYQREGKSKEAIEMFTKAASLDPNHPDPRLNLAVLHEEMGEWTAAMEWYKQAETRLRDPEVRKWVTLRALWMSEIAQGASAPPPRGVAGKDGGKP